MNDYVEHNRDAYDTMARSGIIGLETSVFPDVPLVTPFINTLEHSFRRPVAPRYSYEGNYFKSMDVLELGPGRGIASQLFDRGKLNTTAVDVSQGMIGIARINSPRTIYIHDDFLETRELDEQGFYGVYARAFIHLFPKKDSLSALDKIYNLLLNNGVLYLSTTIHPESEEGYFPELLSHEEIKVFMRHWEEGELINAINNAGFEIYKQWHDDFPMKKETWANFLAIKQ